jgi:FKBP-type peptidyl-prolyl cis-trans isomerase
LVKYGRMIRVVFAATVAVLFLMSFPSDASAQRRRPTKKVVKVVHAANFAGAIKTASGLSYIVLEKGTGRVPKPGETVAVHYTGTLTNGVRFDSSRDRGEPIEFPLGVGRVIKGWDEGIAKLRTGDKAILIIPPHLGYGARGAGGDIPPNATLVFIVELVNIR